MPARASADSSVASRAIPIDLRPVISAYRKRGRFQLRIEKLPQSARFSAGQNNGDGSWSLLLDELEDLVYFAPKTVNGDHTLAIRLIAKDETEAFTIALIDYRVPGDAGGTASPASTSLPDDVRNELHKLKSLLEARDSELAQLRESAERMGVMLQQKLDAAVAQAQASWKQEEAARLLAEKARLEEQYGNRLAEREMHAQALAEIASEQQAAALRMMRQEFAATKDALAARDSELAASRAQMERVRKDWEAEIASTKAAVEVKAAAALKVSEAEWAARLDKASAELKSAQQAVSTGTARVRADSEAELAALRVQMENLRAQSQAELAAARAALESKVAEAIKTAQAGARAEHDGEMERLRADLERQHQQAQAEIVAVNARAAERLKAAEAEWKSQSDKALAQLAAQQASPMDLRAPRDNRVAELAGELERERHRAQAEIADIKAAAEARNAEMLKAAEIEWQKRSDDALSLMTARLDAALAASAPPDRDEEVKNLQGQVEHLQKWSQAEISALQAAAAAREARSLKDAEATWRAQSDAALALATARCEAAEAALAAAGSGIAERDAEIGHLRAEIAQQAQMAGADMAAAKAAADIAAGEKLKAAQAIWEQETAGALAKANARYDAAEAALEVERRAAATRARDDEYVHSLEREIKTLRATLVDREAALVQTQAVREHARLGTLREGPATRWQPLTDTRPVGDSSSRPEKDRPNRQLLRDIGVVAMVAAAAVLLLPKLEAMLPNAVRWQIETVGGLYVPAETVSAPPHAVPAAAVPPKADHPIKYAARAINVRVQPTTGAAVAANLKRGAVVAVLETRGSWDRVEIQAGQAPLQQGWVFNTYLTDTDPTAASPQPVGVPQAAPAPVSPPPAQEISASTPPASEPAQEAAAPSSP